MKFKDRAPEIEEVQVVPEAPALPVIDLRPFAFDIAAAVDTAGPEETGAALTQVQSGSRSSEALLAWIDDLRDAEHQASDVDPADQQEGIIPDFMKDNRVASGAADTPPPSGNAEIETPPHSDDDYFSWPYGAADSMTSGSFRRWIQTRKLQPMTTRQNQDLAVARSISILRTLLHLSPRLPHRATAVRAAWLALLSSWRCGHGRQRRSQGDRRPVVGDGAQSDLARVRACAARVPARADSPAAESSVDC
jgi:hypothetical protein